MIAMAKWGQPSVTRRATLISSVPPPPPSSAPMPPAPEPTEPSGIRRVAARKCDGPAWLKDEYHRFHACGTEFVCDDPSCKEHAWSEEDRKMLSLLKREREALMNMHSRVMAEHGSNSPSPNPQKCKSSLGAFLRANSRLYTFVVRKAVERSQR